MRTGASSTASIEAGRSPYPMMPLNGLVVAKPDRRNPTSDYDLTPRQFRQHINASGLSGRADVQIHNGMRDRILSGKRWPYRGTGYLFGPHLLIPGQTRGDVAGFLVKGPAPQTWNNIWQAGPGSQPANPGGPATLGAAQFINPMTG